MADLLICVAFLLIGGAPVHTAAVQKKANSSDAVRSAVIRDFADHLSGIPVEYHADLLFAMLSKEPNALSPQSQIKLLRELFERAPTAQSQTPVTEATTSRESTMAHQRALDSSTVPFDTLDIQARVVSLLRNRSPVGSWELLQQISLPTRRSDCTDGVIPELAPYYQVMASSLNAIKSTTVPDGRTKLVYLLERIDEIETPAQLRAFAESAVTLDLDPSQGIPIFEAVVSRMSAINGSDREMVGASNEDNNYRLPAAIAGLMKIEKINNVSPVPLLLAYRALLVRNLHTAACSDSTSDRVAEAATFNALSSELIGEAPKPVGALSSQELTPTGVAGAEQKEIIEDDGRPNEQMRRIAQIYMANQRALYQSDSMDGFLQPRPSDVQDALRHLAELSKDDTSSTVVRFEKQMGTIHMLAMYLPPGPSLRYSISADVAFLNLNPVEQQYPLSWLRYFHELLFNSRQLGVEAMPLLRRRAEEGDIAIGMPSPDATFIRETLRRYQSDPIFAAYLVYEDIFHPPYESDAEIKPSPPL